MLRILKIFENILFPKFCLSCGKWGVFVCEKCRSGVLQIGVTICPYCSKRTLDGFTHPLCGSFGVRIDGLWSVFYYQGVMSKILTALKYRSATVLLGVVEDLLALVDLSSLSRYLGNDAVLVSVPLHPARESRRGFNQSQEIASIFSKILDLPLENKLLRRVKNTPPQAKTKSKSERLLNMNKAFAVSKTLINDYKNKSIVIVDDIYTSGTTTKEIARVLKSAGCRRVLVLTLCH